MKWFKYIGLALLGIAGFTWFLISRDRRSVEWVAREMKVVDAQATAKKLEAKLDHTRAKLNIKARYREELMELEHDARMEVEALVANKDVGASELAARILRAAKRPRLSD